MKELTKDIIQWDVRSWKKALKYWDKHIDWETVENCLGLGERQGGLSLWLALKGKHVVCSDLSQTQELASPLHEKYGVQDLITYEDINATNIPYENHFDVIIFKSIMGGVGYNDNIENQVAAFENIYKALKPGGKLLFAENLTGSPLHRLLRKKFVAWGKSWRYIGLKELQQQFLSKYKISKIKTTGMFAAFGRREWQRNFLACFDGLIFNYIFPRSWKYISFGIAEKPLVE